MHRCAFKINPRNKILVYLSYLDLIYPREYALLFRAYCVRIIYIAPLLRVLRVELGHRLFLYFCLGSSFSFSVLIDLFHLLSIQNYSVKVLFNSYQNEFEVLPFMFQYKSIILNNSF